MLATNQIKKDYWEKFSVSAKDIEYIYNLLLEKEIPLSSEELIRSLISNRIVLERQEAQNKLQDKNDIYLPKNIFKTGDKLIFPSYEMKVGVIQGTRDGFNPDYEKLVVLDVEFESGEKRSFASNVSDHPLNHILDISDDDPNYDLALIFENHQQKLTDTIESSLQKNEDLVKIAGNWFPRSLLVDVHVGILNLAEAILEEAKGGPIGTAALMNQADLNANVDKKLLEFSFNLALQEDDRFDEVGPAGETLWYLHAMEPDSVKNVPLFLIYGEEAIDSSSLTEYLEVFEDNIYDELETWDSEGNQNNRIIISLSFPHWRSGTLPLSNTIKKMFPTAHEAPRVKFTFIDENEEDNFPGWVVRKHKYIFGLKKWYEDNDLMPGSLVTVEKGKNPGEINISFEKSRQNKEWVKTVLIGSDQAVVFAMLKQSISANFNERMAISVTDIDALDVLWDKKVYLKEPIQKTVTRIMRELAKLNPQGQVHAQELYAAVNVVRRCPPSMIVHQLITNPAIEHLGDLYFKFGDKEK
ncbi:MAG: hypothetical protein Q7J07_00730 [Pelolinea sp.]|nr:hypothetical protein [Pelolinea sp.]